MVIGDGTAGPEAIAHVRAGQVEAVLESVAAESEDFRTRHHELEPVTAIAQCVVENITDMMSCIEDQGLKSHSSPTAA